MFHDLRTSVAAIIPAVFGLLAWATPSHAEVLDYYARLTTRGGMELVGVTVARGGSPVTFDAAKLIGARVTHLRSYDSSCLIVAADAAVPSAEARAGLLADRLLNTGVINPGGQKEPLAGSPVLTGPNATPGMAVEFLQPVVNRPGDDVVIFEFHREAGSPIGGDPFHLSPLRFRPGRRSITVDAFDFPCNDPRALPAAAFDVYRSSQPPGEIGDLQAKAIQAAGRGLADFKILAVAIDLSDLGYAEGESVDGLFLQNRAASGLSVDPVLIAGLPAADPANLLASAPKSRLVEAEREPLLPRMLAGPLAGVEEIVFAVRVAGWDHWYANFGFYAASTPEYPPSQGIPGEEIPPLFGEGGRLCRLDLRTGQVKVLLDDPHGGVRDPQVHYDGKTILFSYRRGGQPYFRLYEIQSDGTGLRALTDGPFDDIEPTYLPDGGILFCSSRSNRFVNCYRTPVATLCRCDGDGGNVRMISTNIEHDNTPWPLSDGRILHMRWEYVDRSQFAFHHLWTTNPDGTAPMVFYGNQFNGGAMLDAKPIPGTAKIVASFSPGHGLPEHMGAVTVVDPRLGPDAPQSARTISKPGQRYRDPYPLSENCFLAADTTGLVVMDGEGNTELVYRLPADQSRLSCHEPRPLAPRQRELVIPPRVDLAQTSGRLFLGDIYHGRNMEGVARGSVKKLLVLEQLPKPINFSGGMWPITVGGSFTLARVLGTVPVEPDGSASFEAPAMRSLFFVALDENDLSVKRMQSFVSLQPGETTGCVGCHEPRVRAPLVDTGREAFQGRTARQIEPITDVPDVLDFPRDIQPILDRHCVTCHQPERPEGRVDLCGDHTPLFCQSYWTIMKLGLISDGRNEPAGNRAPRAIGSSASRLLKLFDGSHYEAKASPREWKTLRLWIDSGAVYAGTYAALGTGMYPVEMPHEAIERRCGGCHATDPPAKGRIGTGRYFRFGSAGPYLPLVHQFTDLQRIRGSIGYYKFGSARPPQSLCNLSRPEQSLLLRAPLAKSAGGLEWCGQAVLPDASDPTYQAILAAVRAAAQRHDRWKRFDLAGFRPNVYYVRMLQSYGALPAELRPEDPINVYAADQAYWRSFWHRPESR